MLTDPNVPSIVMGAHLVHPGPDEPFRPSYATVVGSVGSDNSKYIAVSSNLLCRVETIEGLTDMVSVSYSPIHEMTTLRGPSLATRML